MGRPDRLRGEEGRRRAESYVGKDSKEVSIKMSSSVNPTVPTGPTKNQPVPPTNGADMEHFHKLATSGALSDLMFKLGGGKKK
jgi:hypothetical protein